MPDLSRYDPDRVFSSLHRSDFTVHTNSIGRTIAIVIPWFGKDLKGGAEQQAWQMATRLAARGHGVEVLTTCGRSFQDHWAENHYPEGVSREDGLVIRRFALRRSSFHDFNALNGHLLRLDRDMLKPGVSPVPGNASEVFASDSVNAQGLLNHLRGQGQNYAAVVFLPYLYGPILNGLPLVAERAFLMPCLHDEAYAYLPQVERIFRKARGILYLSAGEQALAERLYGPGIVSKGVLVGAGVELVAPHAGSDTNRILDQAGEAFVLCLGRRDPHKNTDFLVRAHQAYRSRHPESRLRLVLAGPGDRSYDDRERGVVDLGLVSEEDKAVLLAKCRALFHPSENESYSRVIMEAWFSERPVAAHGRCLATATVVRRSGGGWLAETLDQWVDLFATVEQASEDELSSLGRLGQAYAREHASWERVVDRYEQALGLIPTSAPAPEPPETSRVEVRSSGRSVHQIVAGFRLGDAISNYARAIREQLLARGLASEIYLPGQHLDSAAQHLAHPFQDGCIKPGDGLIYHHSIGSDLTPFAATHNGPKCLIYHNITPAHFYTPYSDARVSLLEGGRTELGLLAAKFSLSVGVSAYNAQELALAGFHDPGVLPLIVDPAQWNNSPGPTLMARFQDGRTNILFVGRLAPNKRQDQLIRAFAAYRTLDPFARLILAGGYDLADPYYVSLTWMVDKFGLGNNVVFLGSISDSSLQSCYRTAHLFWSMSEHEGFGVPLIEAMWFNIPVLALASSAVPETMGGAGALIHRVESYSRLAALAHVLIRDEQVRQRVIQSQRERREAFVAERFHDRFQRVLDRMGLG
ncbi:glycosyltransferase family 4 protein [Desulfonatronum thiodismutans]|uniref:glycosyltransferase family 4 protein n=1 Tax=Desulfonatronum thiodismutans TaxID=159290 RepID=UPI0009FD99DA|nr:glycosyltransferase [Desulfonatronum thiodismutans]